MADDENGLQETGSCTIHCSNMLEGKSSKTSDHQHQQWEYWECDLSSWDYNDQEPFTDDDSIDESELFLQCEEPISKPSSFLVEDEDSRHLFAASLFTCNEDDESSVDSSRTARTSNKKKGSEQYSSSSKLDSITKKTASVFEKAPIEKVELNKDKITKSISDHLHDYDSYQSRKQHIRRRSWPWIESVDAKRGVAVAVGRQLGTARAA